MLPGAHIDDQKTCLMLTDEVYNQYLYVQQQAQQREKEKQKRQEELKNSSRNRQNRMNSCLLKIPSWLPPSGRDGR